MTTRAFSPSLMAAMKAGNWQPMSSLRRRQEAASLVPWLDQNAECPPPLLSLLARAEGIVANGCALAQNPTSCSAMLQSRMNIFGRTMVRPCCRPP